MKTQFSLRELLVCTVAAGAIMGLVFQSHYQQSSRKELTDEIERLRNQRADLIQWVSSLTGEAVVSKDGEVMVNAFTGKVMIGPIDLILLERRVAKLELGRQSNTIIGDDHTITSGSDNHTIWHSGQVIIGSPTSSQVIIGGKQIEKDPSIVHDGIMIGNPTIHTWSKE